MKRHYHIVIVFCCFLVTLVNLGFASTSFGVYQSYIVELPGVGDVGGSLVVTIRILASFACMFFAERYYEKIDARLGIALVSLCCVIGFVIFATVPNLVGMCVGSVFTGIAYGMGGMVAVTYIIGNWFKKSLGTALGWVAVGSGVASFAVPVVSTAIIHAASLQTAFLVEGVSAFGLAAVAIILVRTRPSQMGLAMYGAEGAETDPGAPEKNPGLETPSSSGDPSISEIAVIPEAPALGDSAPEVPAPEAPAPEAPAPDAPALSVPGASSVPAVRRRKLSRPAFFAMLVALTCLGANCMVGMAMFGILMTSEGIEPFQVAFLLSLMGVCLTFSKVIMGFVCDHLGTIAGSALFYGLLVVGYLASCLIGFGGIIAAAIAAVLFGIGTAIGSTGISLWALELSYEEERLNIIRFFQGAFLFGGFVFNLLPGVLKVLTGTYETMFVLLTLMCVLSSCIVVGVCRMYHLNGK